jgi:hemolysin activation/secretion protein
VRAEHPLVRTRERSLWVNGGFDWIDSSVDVSGGAVKLSDDELRVLFLGAEGALTDPYGTTGAWLELRQGLDVLGASDEGDEDLSRAGASGDFFLMRGEVTREQPIRGAVSAHARVAGQWSPDPLLVSEAFSLGGYRYLKGYDPSELLGDSGVAAHGELRYTDRFTFQELDFGYEVYGFGSYGVVFQSETPGDDSAELVSAGAGVRLDIPNGPRLEVEVAKPLGDDLLRTGDRDLRVLGGLVWFF